MRGPWPGGGKIAMRTFIWVQGRGQVRELQDLALQFQVPSSGGSDSPVNPKGGTTHRPKLADRYPGVAQSGQGRKEIGESDYAGQRKQHDLVPAHNEDWSDWSVGQPGFTVVAGCPEVSNEPLAGISRGTGS